jgi:hypothetical protein
MTGGTGADIFSFGTSDATAVTAASGAALAAGALTSGTSTINITNADIITDFGSGVDTLQFTTAHAMALATAGTLTNDQVTLLTGSYSGTTFTYSTSVTSATTGYATLAVYDTDATTGTAFKAILLVGYLNQGEADAFGGTVTGLQATA